MSKSPYTKANIAACVAITIYVSLFSSGNVIKIPGDSITKSISGTTIFAGLSVIFILL